jgi:hypothetical protein
MAHSFYLSLAAVAGAALLHGSLLSRHEIAAVSEDCPCSIGRVSIKDDHASAVVAFTVVDPLGGAHRHLAGAYDLTAQPPAFEVLCPQLDPWRAVTASGGEHAFISTRDGRLYSLDMRARSGEPLFLGKQDPGHADWLECTPDGSIVVVGWRNLVSVWHRESKRLLWQRADLTCGTIRAEPNRIVCATEAGEVLEIDLASGRTLRKIAAFEQQQLALAVSPCGRYLASLDYSRHVLISKIHDGSILWSCRCAEVVGPRFSPDGNFVLVAYSSRSEQLAIHCAATGRKLRRLSGIPEPIRGLAVSGGGIVFAWGDKTITACNLTTGSIVFRLFPERDWKRR